MNIFDFFQDFRREIKTYSNWIDQIKRPVAMRILQLHWTSEVDRVEIAQDVIVETGLFLMRECIDVQGDRVSLDEKDLKKSQEILGHLYSRLSKLLPDDNLIEMTLAKISTADGDLPPDKTAGGISLALVSLQPA